MPNLNGPTSRYRAPAARPGKGVPRDEGSDASAPPATSPVTGEEPTAGTSGSQRASGVRRQVATLNTVMHEKFNAARRAYLEASTQFSADARESTEKIFARIEGGDASGGPRSRSYAGRTRLRSNRYKMYRPKWHADCLPILYGSRVQGGGWDGVRPTACRLRASISRGRDMTFRRLASSGSAPSSSASEVGAQPPATKPFSSASTAVDNAKPRSPR